jgi:beta-lactamase regulating signal transducer with metallopeptidase domain
LALLAAAPFLLGRLVEPVVTPRAALWMYFASLIAVVGVVLGVATFLFLYLAPAPVVARLGTACVHGAYCVHSLPLWASFTLWLGVAAVLLWLLTRIVWTAAKAVRASRAATRAVRAGAVRVDEAFGPAPVFEIPDGAVIAHTVGFLRPVIVVSRGLRESLSPQEFGVVLAHEQAHAAGHDTVILLVARVVHGALSFFPGITRALDAVRRCAELAADDRASDGTGDRLLVAMSVNRVARMLATPAGARSFAAREAGAAFAHAGLAVERVRRLVSEDRLKPSRRRLLCSVAALAMVIGVLSMSLYVVTGHNLTGASGAAVCVENTVR